MALSSIATEQREKEVEALKSFLAYSFIGSLALHIGVLTFGIGNFLNRIPEITDEPIEVAIVDPPIQELEPKEESSRAGAGSGTNIGSGGDGGSIASGGGGSPHNNASTLSSQPSGSVAIAPSVPSIIAAKQSPPIATPVQKLVENSKTKPSQQQTEPTQVTKPAQTPSPEVATEPKPVIESSPIPAASPEPASTPQFPVAKNPPTQKVTPSVTNSPLLQNRESTEKSRNLLTGVRNSRENQQIAANSTVSSDKPSGVGTRQVGVAGGSGNSLGSRFGTGSGTGTGTGNGSSTGTGTGTGNGSGSGTGTGTGTGIGNGSGRGSTVATGSRNIRRASPGAASGNRDTTGAGDGGVACRSNCKPLYPESARRQGEEGQPQLRIDIGSDGKATNIRLARSSGNRELDEAALRGARRAKYKAPSGGRQGVLVKVDFAIEGSERHRQLQERRKRNEVARSNRRTTTANAPEKPAAQAAERSAPTRRIRRKTSVAQPAVRARNASISPRSTQTAATRQRRVETVTPRRPQQATPPRSQSLRQSLRRQRPSSQQAAPQSQTRLRNSLRTYQQRSQSAPKPANSAPNSDE